MKKCLSILLFLIVAIFGSETGTTATEYTVTQIANCYNCGGPDINHDGYVVWVEYDGTDYEIFLYDGTSTIQLTNNTYNDYEPQINNNGYVAWRGSDASGYQIFLYDGTTTTQISNNSYDNQYLQINNNGYVVWEGWGDTDYEIFLYDGTSTIQLTNNTYNDYEPQINDNGYVVWMGFDGTDLEIFLYDGATTTNISNDSDPDYYPQINNNGYVVWEGYDGIFLYDGTTTTQVWQDPDHGEPQINNNGYICFPRDGDIGLYDGTTHQRLYTFGYRDEGPQISDNGYVVWTGDGDSGSAGYEIFLYDGTSPIATQLTSNTYSDRWPQINDHGYVVWDSGVGILLASPENTPLGQDVVVEPEDCPHGAVGGSPVKVTFDSVTGGGNTMLHTSGTGQPPPSGLKRILPSTYYEINTTATHSGNIEVCIDCGNDYPDENKLKLFHQSEGQPWQNVTSSLDTQNNIICGTVDSFSVFAIFAPVDDDGPAVGGVAEPTDKMQLLIPWMTLATLILLTIGIVVFRLVRK